MQIWCCSIVKQQCNSEPYEIIRSPVKREIQNWNSKRGGGKGGGDDGRWGWAQREWGGKHVNVAIATQCTQYWGYGKYSIGTL